MSTVRVRCFAALRERVGAGELTVELLPGETLGALYDRLFPAGPQGALPVAYVRNRVQASRDDHPEDGDEIAFLPPIGGG